MNTMPKPEFPRPEKERKNWLNLNGSWQFELFAAGKENDEKLFAENRAAFTRTIQVPFSWVCPLSGVQENTPGIGWYRRTVNFAPKGRVFLCFGAVDYKTDVYVNGQHAGFHQGGYSYFEFDVTALWQAGENTIEVRAEDYQCETQLYGKQGYGEIQGIWQTVWLENRPEAYITDWTVTTKIDGTVTFSICADAPDGTAASARFDDEVWFAEIR